MHVLEIARHLRHVLAQLKTLKWVLATLSRNMTIYYIAYNVHKWMNAVIWYACTSVPSKIQPHTGTQTSSQMLFGCWWRQKTWCAGEGLLLHIQSRLWPLLKSRFACLTEQKCSCATFCIIIIFTYTSFRIPVLAAVCQILILPSSGLKRHIIHLLSCLAPSFTQVSQTPMCKGNVFQMTPGSQQTSVHAPSRILQEIPSTSSRLTRHWIVKRTELRQ